MDRFFKAIAFVIGLNLLIRAFAWVFSESVDDAAINVLIGVVAAVAANRKEVT